jgi:hypothetical protein
MRRPRIKASTVHPQATPLQRSPFIPAVPFHPQPGPRVLSSAFCRSALFFYLLTTVRNRAKELADLLSDSEKIRTERRKSKQSKNKYTGVGSEESGFGGSGKKYGGFGSDDLSYGSYSGQVYGTVPIPPHHEFRNLSFISAFHSVNSLPVSLILCILIRFFPIFVAQA